MNRWRNSLDAVLQNRCSRRPGSGTAFPGNRTRVRSWRPICLGTNAGWGWESERDIEVAETVLKETDLSELSGRLMSELSGGERQRAVLARALATEAQFLLLDEPTANLDMSHQATLLSLVRQRCDERRAAALVVTHDINLAAQFADIVMLMKSGTSSQNWEHRRRS